MFILNTWYIAAWAEEVADKPFARRICDEALVFFRDKQSGQVAALADMCCHRGAPLSLGTVVEEGLECGYHGVVHDCSGKCVYIPGQDRIPEKARVRSYPVVEKNEFIWIWMGDPELADESLIVDYPYNDDHSNWPHKHGFYHIKAGYMLMVDNLMDLTHLGYVHRTTIGGNPMTHVKAEMDVTRDDKSLKYVRWMINSVPPPTYCQAVDFEGSRVDRWQEFAFSAPSNILQWSGAVKTGNGAREHNRREGGFSLRIFHGLTPETENTCFYFFAPANGYKQDDPKATELLFDHIAEAFMEDKLFCEGQQARIDAHGESHLVDIVSDATRIQLRRIIQRMLDAEKKIGAPASAPLPRVEIPVVAAK